MTIPELDPTIKEISTIYNFKIKYDEDLKRWDIESNRRDSNFYWNSTYEKFIFFENLKTFFFDQAFYMFRLQ